MFILLLMIFLGSVASKDSFCLKNQTILQVDGDAVLTVFIDASSGPYCNESLEKGYQEVSTVLYVISILNRHDYIPGITLGLKMIDTCQDPKSVYKHCLMMIAESDCTENQNHYYDLGILTPENYIPVLQPLLELSDLPISYYFNKNTTNPLIQAAVHFVRENFNEIELLLTDCDSVLEFFLRKTSDVGVCVKNINDLGQLDVESDGLIVVIGGGEIIRSWINDNIISRHKNWFLVPIDDSNLDDIVPFGSYVIKSESHGLEFEDHLTAESKNKTVQSPNFLGIGKSIFSIAELFSEIKKNNCLIGQICSLPFFDTKLLKNHTISQIIDELKLPFETEISKYTVSQHVMGMMENISTYSVNIETFQVITNRSWTSLMNKCEEISCSQCLNFEKKEISHSTRPTTSSNFEIIGNEPKTFKTGFWFLLVLALVVCGTIISIAIGIFIIYSYLTNDTLDGNPMLTILLIVACISLLHSSIFFFFEDYYIGHNTLNSMKIYTSTLSSGLVFSIMLTRSFFLAFFAGRIFTSHVNGYLQGIMLFFVAGVQMGMSTMYLLTSSERSNDTVRSPLFICLLCYDIFLLLSLLGVGILYPKTSRNYQEGRCFYFTTIGMTIVWILWISTFLLVNQEWRDLIVSLGLISTGYFVIIGTLAPRVHFMLKDIHGNNKGSVYVDGDSLRIHTTQSSSTRQPSRSFSDYTLPMKNMTTSTTSTSQLPDQKYCANSSFMNKKKQYDDHEKSYVDGKTAHYNSGYHSDGQVSENHYVIPKVSIEDSRTKKNLRAQLILTNFEYAQPYSISNYQDNFKKKNMETDFHDEKCNKLSSPNKNDSSRSPSPSCLITGTLEEKENQDIDTIKITRF